MDEEEDGSETLLPTPMVLDLVDFSLAVLPSQAPSFLADPVEAIPKSASLLTQAYEWLQMAEGHRINYYTAAEEEVPPLPTRQQKRQGPAILAEDPAPKKPWVKRVTAAALAEQVSHLVQVIPALTQQLEALQLQQTRLEEVVSGGTARLKTPAYRQPCSILMVATSKAARGYLEHIGPPPRTRQPALSPPANPTSFPPTKGMQQLQEAQGSDIPVSQLLLQQSEALKALVSHVANQDGFLDYGAGSASSSFLSSERIWPPEKEISC